MSELGQLLIKLVRQKAYHDPDMVYLPPGGDEESCMYVHADGQPGCLIGQALFEAGVIDAKFFKSINNTNTITQLAREVHLPITSNELSWLAEVQCQQDERKCWAVAVAGADERHPI